MKASEVLHSGFLDNLGSDLVAVAPNGNVVGRASSREALERAHAGADVTILSAADFVATPPTIAAAATAPLEGPFAAIVAQGVKDPDGNEPLNAAPKTLKKAKEPDFAVLGGAAVAPKATPVALSPGKSFEAPNQAAIEADPSKQKFEDPAHGQVPMDGSKIDDRGFPETSPLGTHPAHDPNRPARTGADGSAFDHDSDGRTGGSLPRSSRQRRPAGK